MKRTILLLLWCMAVCGASFAQSDFVLGDFEGGAISPFYSGGWQPGGVDPTKLENVDNPDASGINTSSKALKMVYYGDWGGGGLWIDDPTTYSDYDEFWVDAYYVGSTGSLRIGFDNSANSTAGTEQAQTIATADTWVTLKFDLTDVTTGQYKNFGFNPSVDSVFFDNLTFKKTSTDPGTPVTAISVSAEGGATGIATDKGTLQLTASITPENADSTRVEWTIESGTDFGYINEDGLLTARDNGSITVRASATDNSGVYGEATFTITGQAQLESYLTFDLEDEDLSGWQSWDNGTVEIANNPDATGINTSAKVIKVTAPSSYEPAAYYFGESPYVNGVEEVWVDVYVPNVTSKVKIRIDQRVSDTLQEIHDIVIPMTTQDEWVTLKVDLIAHGITPYGYTSFVVAPNYFQELYVDNVHFMSIPVELEAVAINDEVTTIDQMGDTLQLQAVFTPSDTWYQDVTWELVSGTEYADLLSDGKLVAKSNGEVVVKLTSQHNTALSSQLTITTSNQGIKVTSIVVNTPNDVTEITENEGTLQLTAEVTPSNADTTDVDWSIVAGTELAEISAAGLLTAKANGEVTVRATAQDTSGVFGEKIITISNQVVPVTAISINADGATGIDTEGGTLQLQAVVSPEDATDQSVTWTITSGESFATLSETGLLTATANGEVTVRATANDGSEVFGEETFSISNQPILVTGITIEDGGATGIDTDKGALQLSVVVSPENATDASVTWSLVAGSEIASISQEGLLTAQFDGEVTVQAAANDASGVTAQKTYTISNQSGTILVTDITIEDGGETGISTEGGTLQLSASVLPEDATNKNVTWSITDGEAFATISETGLLTATANGTVSVRALAKDGSGVFAESSYTISGQPVKVTSITIEDGGATGISEDQGTLQLSASVKPDTATDQSVIWSITEGEAFATISETGLLTAIANGTVKVKATAGDGNGAFDEKEYVISGQVVLVTAITIEDNGATGIDEPGGTLALSVTVSPEDATDQSVAWSISAGETFASISDEGVLTAQADGEVTVKAMAKDGSGVFAEKQYTISGQPVLVTAIEIEDQGKEGISEDGGTLQLSAKVSPDDATDQTVSWSISEGEAFATIDDTGLLTAVANGQIKVKAMANDGSGVFAEKEYVISGQVVLVTSVEIKDNGTTTISEPEGTLQLTAEVLPEDATDKTVEWSVTAGFEVAAVSETGLLTAMSNGEVTVRAKAVDGSGVFAEKTYTISGQTDEIIKDVTFYDFENGLSSWGVWNGGTLMQVANPDASGLNTSDNVLHLTFPGDWEAVNKWYDASPFTEEVTAVWVDVYVPGSGASVKMNINEPIDSSLPANNETTLDVPTANSWVTLKFDLAGIEPDEYRQIAFFPQGTKEIYVDNIRYKGTPNENPITALEISAAADGISEDNGMMQLSATITPSDAQDPSVSWSIAAGAKHALVTRDGLLVAISDGTVTVQANATDGSGVVAEKQFTISNQQMIDAASAGVGTLVDSKGERMRGTPLIIGKKLENATAYATEQNTFEDIKERSLNTVRLGWVDPWYELENYDYWSLEEALPYIDYSVASATAAGMNIIINYHTVGQFTDNYASADMSQINAFWEIVADRYQHNEYVYYEPLNEPAFGDGAKYIATNFKAELLKVYETIRTKAPKREVLIFSFNNCDETNEQVITSYANDLDWNYTTIAYHLYSTPTTATVQKWMKDYRVMCTEWDYPGSYDYVIDVDGFALGARTLEAIGSSWTDWRENGWGDTSLDQMDDILIPDAKANGYWWGDGNTTLGVPEHKVHVYPNPFDSYLTIAAESSAISSVKVVSLTGQVVLTKAGVALTEMEVAVGQLAGGVYVLAIDFVDGSSKSIKIVKHDK